ncbi:hypothetical protein JRO89_XS04G0055300 [Xanthoceras sorbifolium]|uniref:DUF4216 domain-containing protein n=1 Tax=Xanthoceras sorbifolium TaxID=99658 RepID=A0ABQ8I4U0_9ROSI|nr:hypothetical protein JRO89_XS04G0055300 [Xanthoceras sorbifolium]
MVSLARGPERRAIYYSGYNINGFRFHTIFRDEIRKTQNNGVVVRGENQTDVPYYGRIKDIVELCYTEGNKIVLFDCEWYDTTQEGKGYKRDRYGIITVNIARKLNTQETFVLACQAIQVFYTRGLKDITWSAVTEIKPRTFMRCQWMEDPTKKRFNLLVQVMKMKMIRYNCIGLSFML